MPPLGRLELARLTEFIEDNIDRTIGLAELAEIVNVSRFHFTRLFKRSTGMTAISFVEQCRLRSRAGADFGNGHSTCRNRTDDSVMPTKATLRGAFIGAPAARPLRLRANRAGDGQQGRVSN